MKKLVRFNIKLGVEISINMLYITKKGSNRDRERGRDLTDRVKGLYTID